MSEPGANERRTPGKGPISGLAPTTVNAGAPQQGQGPDGKQPDPGGARVRELTGLFKRAIDSGQTDEEEPVELIRNLFERQHLLLLNAARELAQVEAEQQEAIQSFTANTVRSLESLATMLEESNSQKALEAVRQTQDEIVREYWDRFVTEINEAYRKHLDASKRQIRSDLGLASKRFSDQIGTVFNNAVDALPAGPLRQRLVRERRLIAVALLLGLVLGSFFAIASAPLWNSAVAASRVVLSGFGPAVIPLRDRSGQ